MSHPLLTLILLSLISLSINAGKAPKYIFYFNGDGVGRAAPETQMTCFIGHGVSLYPMPLSDRYGNTVIVEKADSSTYADEVGRFIVCKGGDMGANAHYPMSGAQAFSPWGPTTTPSA